MRRIVLGWGLATQPATDPRGIRARIGAAVADYQGPSFAPGSHGKPRLRVDSRLSDRVAKIEVGTNFNSCNYHWMALERASRAMLVIETTIATLESVLEGHNDCRPVARSEASASRSTAEWSELAHRGYGTLARNGRVSASASRAARKPPHGLGTVYYAINW